MVPMFFVTLREGLEAALIVGIIAAYLVKTGHRDQLPKIWAGVGAAVAISVGAAILIIATIGRLPLVVQETLEGLAALLAVGVLTWMLFWMRRQGRAIKGELERGIQAVLDSASTTALVGLAFIAVIREGLETALLLLAVVQAEGTSISVVLGGIGGLAVAVAVGAAIFVFGVRVNLRRFFTVTGVVLIFVAAGLVANAISEFSEAGLIANTGVAYDLNGILPDSTPLGGVLRGLFGYRSSPTPLEFAGYLLYLIPVLVLFVVDRPILRRPAPLAS